MSLGLIEQAKKDFADKYKETDGFVGIGIGEIEGEKCLRIYLSSLDSEMAKILAYRSNFNGFLFTIHTTGKISAY